MPLASPKVATTRLSIPIGISGEEPANAQVGTLGYATDTDKVRVQTSTGWQDVGGGAGSITTIDSPDGSLVVTNPGGPVVSIEANQDPTTSPFVLQDLTAYTPKTAPGGSDRLYLQNASGGGPRFTEAQYLPLSGDVNGTTYTNKVNKITETSGPTTLTIGAISNGQTLVRSGATIIGSTPVVGGSSRGGLFRSPPAGTAHAQSDEFNSGSSDLATRGWTCINAATGATMTRVGDISNTVAASSLSATQYRSTITPDGVCIQCSNNMFVYKTAVAPYRLVSSGGLSAGPHTAPFEIRPNVVANTTVPLWGSAPGQQNCYVYILLSGGTYSCRARWQNGISDNPNGWAVNDSSLDTFQQGVSNIGAGVATAPYGGWSYIDRWVQGAAGTVTSAGMPRFGFACVTNTAVDNYTPFAFMRYVRVYSMTASPPLL